MVLKHSEMKLKEIVVVEDDNDLRELIGLILYSDQYSVKLLANIQSFDQYMAWKCPDVIVLDVMLPDGNGIEVCQKLKADQKTGHIPVLLMSANSDKRISGSGAEAFFDKPFDIDKFKNKVEGYI